MRRKAVMIGAAVLLLGAVALILFRYLGDGARRSDFELRGNVPSSGQGFKLALYETKAPWWCTTPRSTRAPRGRSRSWRGSRSKSPRLNRAVETLLLR